MMFLILIACSVPREDGLSESPTLDIPIATDIVSELGFSATEVAAHIGTRRYLSAPDLEAPSEHLLESGPFELEVQTVVEAWVHTPDALRAEEHLELLSLVDYSLRSDDGTIEVAGQGVLAAVALSDDQIRWTGRSIQDSATGTLPAWTEQETREAIAEGVCGTTGVGWEDGRRSIYVQGPASEPDLLAQVSWQEGCASVATLDQVVLVPEHN